MKKLKINSFIRKLLVITILYLVLILGIHLYIVWLLSPIKSQILSNAEQVSILRTEMEQVKGNLDVAFDQIYNLEEVTYQQSESIQGLVKEEGNKSKNKLKEEQEVIKEPGVKEGVIAFTVSTLEMVKQGVMNWRINYGI